MGKPDVRHLRGGAGNVAYGGTVNPPRYRKGGAGNPPPTGARASALPDGGLILWTLWITPLAGLCSRWSSALGTRNCHLLPMSAAPSAVRAPRPGGRRPLASDHRVPSAVAPRWRTRPLVDHPPRHEAVRQLAQVDGFVLQGPPQPLDEHRLMNTLSGQRPRPSIEQRTPAACSSPVNTILVSGLP